MGLGNKQIGWSNESNLLWQIAKQLQQLSTVIGNSGGGGGNQNIQQVLDIPSRVFTTTVGDFVYTVNIFESNSFECNISNDVTGEESYFSLANGIFYSSAGEGLNQSQLTNSSSQGNQFSFTNSFGQNTFNPSLPREEAGNVIISNPRNLPTGTYVSGISVNGEYADADGNIIIVAGTDNATVSALSAATLDATYPGANTGFRVYCKLIVGTPLVYEKTADGTWISTVLSIVV